MQFIASKLQICRSADANRTLTTIQPSARRGNGCETDTQLGLKLLFITRSATASGAAEGKECPLQGGDRHI
jgi:hypothetical protein